MKASLGAEKTQQATRQLSAGELWLFLTQEGSDPSVPLVFGSSSVGKAAFLIDETGPKALVSKIDAGHLEHHAPHIEVRSYSASFDDELLRWLKALEPKTLLLNFSETDIRCDGLTHGQFLGLERLLQHLPEIAVQSSERALRHVQSVKTADELRRLQEAIDRTTLMYERLLPQLHAGMTERQVQELMNQIANALDAPAEPGDFGGPLVLISRVGMSHRAPTDEAIRPGDLLILDTALEVEGYVSDIARTVYVLKDGETQPLDRETRVFNAIFGAIDAAFAALKPGAAGFEVDAAARNHLLELGFPEIQHATGHQIGRHVHDGGVLLAPLWDKYRHAASLDVEEGMVLTLEPTVLMSPEPSMIVEENVLVTASGARYLSRRQTTLWTAR